MTREAFDLSERFHVPVMSGSSPGSRTAGRAVQLARRAWRTDPEAEPPTGSWSSCPAQCAAPVARAARPAAGMVAAGPRERPCNTLTLNPERARPRGDHHRDRAQLLVREHRGPGGWRRRTCTSAPTRCRWSRSARWPHTSRRVLVLEDGQPFIERQLRGICPAPRVRGTVERRGTSDGRRAGPRTSYALRSSSRPAEAAAIPAGLSLPNRPPQLCCRLSARRRLRAALRKRIDLRRAAAMTVGHRLLHARRAAALLVQSSRACAWALRSAWRAAPPRPASVRSVAVIGDSTFLHSGDTGAARRGGAEHEHDADHPRQRDRRDDRRPADHPASPLWR